MRRMVLALSPAVLAVLTAAPVLAEETGHGGEQKILGIESGLFLGALELSLWTILVFVLLVIVLRKYAWGPILAGLQQREEGIARDKAEAESARRLAAEARVAAEAEMAQAAARATEMVAKARQDAEATVADQLAKGKAELQAQRDQHRRELEREYQQARQQLATYVAQVATLVASKAIGRQLTIDDHNGLIHEALEQFRAAGKARVEDLESARS
jgi:F-type H+-transporting ATPase subunit b